MIRRKKVLNTSDTPSTFNILYTCLSLLLLCFFIFLVANSVVDPKKKKVSIGSLIGSFGLYKGGILQLGNAKKKELGFALISISKSKDILNNLEDIVKYSRRDLWIELTTEGNAIVLKFKKNGGFNNLTMLKPAAKKVILKTFITLANKTDVKVDIYSFDQSPYTAALRGFNVANAIINTGVEDKKNIKFYAKITNSKYDLMVRFTGMVKNTNNASGLKVGDFFFKLY